MKIDYSNVQILLAIESKAVRIGLRESFKLSGFAAFTEAGDPQSFQQAIEGVSFDLIILDAELGGFFTAPVVAAMRNGRSVHHPFPLVVMLLADGKPAFVHRVVDAGPDDVMMLPVAPGPVLRRIEGYALRRRPFVVTASYIGPDRRRAPRPGTEVIPLIDVPNPMRASMRRVPEAERQSEYELTMILLNALKLERHAVQLRWLEGAIRNELSQSGVEPTKMAALAGSMRNVAQDLPARVRGDLPIGVTDHLRRLSDAATVIGRGRPAVASRDHAGIPELCLALAEAIDALLDPACSAGELEAVA